MLDSGGKARRLTKFAQRALQNLMLAKAGCEVHAGPKRSEAELGSAIKEAYDRHSSLFINDGTRKVLPLTKPCLLFAYPSYPYPSPSPFILFRYLEATFVFEHQGVSMH